MYTTGSTHGRSVRHVIHLVERPRESSEPINRITLIGVHVWLAFHCKGYLDNLLTTNTHVFPSQALHTRDELLYVFLVPLHDYNARISHSHATCTHVGNAPKVGHIWRTPEVSCVRFVQYVLPLGA
jgi:hypothetical protein